MQVVGDDHDVIDDGDSATKASMDQIPATVKDTSEQQKQNTFDNDIFGPWMTISRNNRRKQGENEGNESSKNPIPKVMSMGKFIVQNGNLRIINIGSRSRYTVIDNNKYEMSKQFQEREKKERIRGHTKA